jgi:Bifunctional DNA primase/polymerase, N-terminal
MIEIPSDLNDASVKEAADYYYYKWRINYVPANTKEKNTTIKWKILQEAPLLEDQHKVWKDDGIDGGIALVMGKFWNNPLMEGKFLNCIDMDNKAAIEAWYTKNGKKSLEELAQSYPIEQHADDMNRAHIYIITRDRPLRNKAANRDKDPNVPAMEVMGKGKYVCCTPSTHKNGYKYRFIYGLKPIEEYKVFNADEIENIANDICVGNGIPYLDKNKNVNGKGNGRSLSEQIVDDEEDEKWYEGERHDKLLSKANSLMIKLLNVLPVNDIKELIYAKNKKSCVPPLPDYEVEQICKDTEKYARDVTNGEEKDEKEKQTKAQVALETANNSIKKLFVDEYQTPHAAILVKDHLETLPIKSSRFRNYLASEVYKQNKTVLDSHTLKDVIGILSAQAEFDGGDPIRLNLRVAQVDADGKLTWYYDLTNKDWEFIEITANGWNIVKNQDPNLVLFHRYNNQLAQVVPSNYDTNVFDRFIEVVLNESNVRDNEKLDEYRILLKCYIVCAFIADIPKPIPMPHGTQGAAKTSLMELVKMLIDPSIVLTLSFPRDIYEFIQQLSHNYVAYYDNISMLRDWISDEICRAVSGSGSSKRVLYSDDDDFIRTLMRCIGLNGINLAATSPDILDRGIFFELKRIDDKDRRYIKKIKREFEEMRPQLLGYIMDVLVKVVAWVQEHGMIELDRLPRMADWAGYCEIIARCMGLDEGKFIQAYNNNAKIQVQQVMETSLVATCLARFVENKIFDVKDLEGKSTWGFEGSATQLKKDLDDVALELGIDTKDRDWPKKPNGLTRIINVIMHTLKDAGIEIKYHRKPTGMIIKIRKVSTSSTSSTSLENQAQKEGKNDDDLCR